jgi:hypothetical protein
MDRLRRAPRWLIGVSLVVGCGFQSPAGVEGLGGPSSADAAVDIAIDAAPPCDQAEPDLVACYDFEGDTRDGSSHGLHASMIDVSFTPGHDGLAMRFGPTSAADVPESARLDLSRVTIEAWIRPHTLPAMGQTAGVLDNNGQYAIYVLENGRLQCIIAGLGAITFPANIAIDQWTHVACTYNGSEVALYARGDLLNSVSTSGDISTSGDTGTSLGADNPPGAGKRLEGDIDQVRLYKVGRTEAEICAAAGGGC